MAKLIVYSRHYKATLDSKEYCWHIGSYYLIIEAIDKNWKMLVPREAISYIIEEKEPERKQVA